jgi:hypothetical protein
MPRYDIINGISVGWNALPVMLRLPAFRAPDRCKETTNHLVSMFALFTMLKAVREEQ